MADFYEQDENVQVYDSRRYLSKLLKKILCYGRDWSLSELIYEMEKLVRERELVIWFVS
jgi:hypothetical protein